MAFFGLDFDLSICNGQSHNIVGWWTDKLKRELTDKEKWEIFRQIPPKGTAEQWRKAILEDIMGHGHRAAIVSFNKNAKQVRQYMIEVIGIPQEVMQKIPVISWTPPKPDEANKNVHLWQASRYFGFQGRLDEQVLVDDSEKNVRGAIAAGHRGILVKQDGSHFEEIRELSLELQRTRSSLLHRNLFTEIAAAAQAPAAAPSAAASSATDESPRLSQ